MDSNINQQPQSLPTSQFPVANSMVPNQQHPKSSKKILIILFSILFLLLIVASTVYFYFQSLNSDSSNISTKTSSTPVTTKVELPTSPPIKNETKKADEEIDPTTGWKIFTSTKLNFAVAYPPDWSVSEADQYIDGNIETILRKWTGDPFKSPEIIIKNYSNSNNLNSYDWATKNFLDTWTGNFNRTAQEKSMRLTKLSLPNVDATRINGIFDAEGNNRMVVVFVKGNTVIELIPSAIAFDEKIVNQMVNFFKFTK